MEKELRMLEGQLELTKVKNELDNLQSGDPLFPRDTDTTCALEVIPVHYNMDHEVQRNWYP